MKKLSKILAVVLALALTAGLSVSLTVAYLTDTDEQVNTMTMGNVSIDLLEYERVTDENGEWIPTGTVDKYGYNPEQVQEFTQNKPLYPAVFADGDIKWDDRTNAEGDPHQQSWAQIEAPGSNQLFDDSVKNVQDKFVFVHNDGKSDAYVRTWFAFEQGNIAADDFKNVIMTNTDKAHWAWGNYAYDVEIDGNKYVVMSATYTGPGSNPTGILAPDAVTYASLLQVYMRPEATNEDVINIDGNGNGTYDILVFSQAVQTAGFDNAETALNTAFANVDIAEQFEAVLANQNP